MAKDGKDGELRKIIRRSRAAILAERFNQKNAGPEEFNLPLAILIGVATLPFAVLRNVCKLVVLVCLPPPPVEVHLKVKKAAHAPAGVGLYQDHGWLGHRSGTVRVAYVETTSPFVDSLVIGDAIVNINGESIATCETARAGLYKRNSLHLTVWRREETRRRPFERVRRRVYPLDAKYAL